MRIAALAGVAPSAATRACYESLGTDGPDDYRQLAALLVDEWRRRGIAKVGISGGQGTGKSTLSRLIVAAGAVRGIRAQALSIDDFYRTRAERHRLAEEVHPLLATRGPPGTHDIDAARHALDTLPAPGDVVVPRFDKGIDDRAGHTVLHGPADLVVLEGWCVGAPPAAAAESFAPINALERNDDADGRWRRHVDAALRGAYADLNDAFDTLVFLQAPSLDAVRRWRLQQETERRPEQRLTARQVDRFVAHYERVTRRMLAVLPAAADTVVELGEDHRIVSLRLSPP